MKGPTVSPVDLRYGATLTIPPGLDESRLHVLYADDTHVASVTWRPVEQRSGPTQFPVAQAAATR